MSTSELKLNLKLEILQGELKRLQERIRLLKVSRMESLRSQVAKRSSARNMTQSQIKNAMQFRTKPVAR